MPKKRTDNTALSGNSFTQAWVCSEPSCGHTFETPASWSHVECRKCGSPASRVGVVSIAVQNQASFLTRAERLGGDVLNRIVSNDPFLQGNATQLTRLAIRAANQYLDAGGVWPVSEEVQTVLKLRNTLGGK